MKYNSTIQNRVRGQKKVYNCAQPPAQPSPAMWRFFPLKLNEKATLLTSTTTSPTPTTPTILIDTDTPSLPLVTSPAITLATDFSPTQQQSINSRNSNPHAINEFNKDLIADVLGDEMTSTTQHTTASVSASAPVLVSPTGTPDECLCECGSPSSVMAITHCIGVDELPLPPTPSSLTTAAVEGDSPLKFHTFFPPALVTNRDGIPSSEQKVRALLVVNQPNMIDNKHAAMIHVTIYGERLFI